MTNPIPEQIMAKEFVEAHGLEWCINHTLQNPEDNNKEYVNDLALLIQRVKIEAKIEVLDITQGVVSEPGDFMYSTKLVAQKLRAQLATLTDRPRQGDVQDSTREGQDVTGD